MADRPTDIRGARLRAELKAQGRSVTWLAKATGYTRPYVSAVLTGASPWTEEFQKKVAAVLGEPLTVQEHYRGLTIKVPAAIYSSAAWTPEVSADAYEDAWKRRWASIHGDAAVAVAAERAWQLALASSSSAGGGDAA